MPQQLKRLRNARLFALSVVVALVFSALSALPSAAALSAANTRNTSMGTEMRTLRLAVSAAAGYSAQFVGAGSTDLEKKQNVYKSIQVGIDRINQVYEVEIGVHLALLPFNSNLIFLDSKNEPFGEADHHVDGPANQKLLDSVIGSANYDIGHVLTKKGGGVGSMNALTYPKSKGSASSGGTNAIGDKFWIELVAHEMGHQLAANHSFDGTQSMCGGQVEAGYNTEVGSGSSIMSYAATCGADDIQTYSDPYFTPFSYEEIRRELAGAPLVGTTTATGNSVPQIAVAAGTYFIPPQTPFALTATGSDADSGDVLTYSWDQVDTTTSATGKSLASEPKLSGALFRPYSPSESGFYRSFPKLSSIFAGVTNQSTGSCLAVATASVLTCRTEFLPTTARDLHFRATVRDGVGGRNSVNSTVSVVGSTPFAITSQNTNLIWRSGSTQTVTWNTGGSESWANPYSTVDILYTSDEGLTWTTLATGVTNDGTQDVVAPAISTSRFRFKVQPVGAIFFDINDADLTVSQSSPELATPPIKLAAAYTANAVGGVTLTWLAPLDAGTSTIVRYDITAVQDSSKKCSTTSVAPSTPALTCNITGLTVGTAYSFVATATNATGASEVSSPTTAIVAGSVPDAPTITAVEQTSTGAIKVTYKLNATNGAPITSVKIGHWLSGATNYTSRVTLTNSGQTSYVYTNGLTVGKTYKFTVWALNAVGLSAVSTQSALITSATVPAVPTTVSATPGDGQATISWVTGASNGSSITSYTATASPGGQTCVANTGSPIATTCSISGLTNGTSYTVTVVATNALGNSALSAASAAFTPVASNAASASLPIIQTQPSGASALLGQSVSFSVSASVSDGGQLSYQWFKDGLPIANATSATLDLSGLSLADSGSYSVEVTNTLNGTTAKTSTSTALLNVKKLSALVPSFATPTSTLDGFEVAISNYDAAFTWSVSVAQGPGAVTRSGNTITVTGLGSGESATISVLVTRTGYEDGSASLTSQASSALPVIPEIVIQPKGSSKKTGENATITVSASISDGGLLSYQWFKNGSPISGAVSDTLNFTSLTLQDAGDYSVTVTNTVSSLTASATSLVASLEVVPAPIPVSGVTLDKSKLSMTLGGATNSLIATVSPVDATNKAVTWSSSNPLVVRVSSTGVLTAVAAGSAIVSVATVDGSFSASSAVTVVLAAQSVLTVSNKILSGTVGKAIVLTATGGSGNGSVSFQVTGSGCSISGSLLTASAATDCSVTAIKAASGIYGAVSSASRNFTFVMPVIPVSSVALDKTALRLVVGTAVALVATVAPQNATDKTLKWASSNSLVVNVSSTGVVTAVGPGVAKISATSINGKLAILSVTVLQPVTGLIVDTKSMLLAFKTKQSVAASVEPTNATNKSLIWSTSNSSVATVVSGVVTAKSKVGVATITVTTVDGAFTATIKVTVTKTGK